MEDTSVTPNLGAEEYLDGIKLPTVEGSIGIESVDYHGKKITVFTIEHHDVVSKEAAIIEKVPTNWGEKLEEVVKEGDTVFLEYFPKDLKRVMNTPILGRAVKYWYEKSGIALFDKIADKVDAIKGKIKVTDVASSFAYGVQEVIVDEFRLKDLMKRKIMEKGGSLSDADLMGDEEMMKIARSIDARRLMTARAIMQESLKEDSGDVVWVGPEAHAKWIKYYIDRQKNIETDSKVVIPVDMINMCPPAEKEKAAIYKKKVGFNNDIRTYAKDGSGKWNLTTKQKIY